MATPPVCGWTLEEAARKHGALRIAGVDEVGRGPLFGPVVAAAVILPQGCRLDGLTDSKKLSEKKRNELDLEIRANAVAWAIAAVDAETIDRINIRQASLLAMRRAVEQLALSPDYLLIDGARHHRLGLPAAGGHPRRRHQLFHCRRQRAGQGLSRPAAGGAGPRVSRLRPGAAQGLRMPGTPGRARPPGPHPAAPQELSSGGARRCLPLTKHGSVEAETNLEMDGGGLSVAADVLSDGVKGHCDRAARFACPCCGNLTLAEEPPGTFAIARSAGGRTMLFSFAVRSTWAGRTRRAWSSARVLPKHGRQRS